VHRTLAPLCFVIGVACASSDSNDGLSGGQPYDPTGDETTASEASGSTSSASMSATSIGEASSGSSESTAAIEPTSDCCSPAAAPGCTDPKTEACVCAIRLSCCEDAWSVECAGIAVDGCGSPCGADTMDPSDDTMTDEPLPSCGELAETEGFVLGACEVNGNGACNGMGTPTNDCDFCCDVCETGNGLSCGQLAEQQGWEFANCESDTNNACNGTGTPTCDCNFCCEVML
jgi:hypothetical protein